MGRGGMEKIDGRTLTGVSGTSLFTLWNRGVDAPRPDTIFDVPLAMELVERINYPYRDRFGLPQQAFAMRALAFDSVVRDYVREQPTGAVIALRACRRSYWRLGRPQLPWITGDLAPVIALRKRLLPDEEYVVNVTASVLDRTWMDVVSADCLPARHRRRIVYVLRRGNSAPAHRRLRGAFSGWPAGVRCSSGVVEPKQVQDGRRKTGVLDRGERCHSAHAVWHLCEGYRAAALPCSRYRLGARSANS
jgi:hypothetical protein